MMTNWGLRLFFLTGICLLLCSCPWDSPGHKDDNRPNIIFILSDDEDIALHQYMPKTEQLLHQQGTTLSNFFVTYSLCCPSRSSILTGQYPQNTHIIGNLPPSGGWETAYSTGLEQRTVAMWLQNAGYYTMLASKYLNGYGHQTDPKLPPLTYVPPGWNEWYGGIGDAPYNDYNYSLNENGKLVDYGAEPNDYLTDVIGRKAVASIHKASSLHQPFFIMLAPFTPHLPANYAPRHEGLFADAHAPRPPSFNEADVSDKPPSISSRILIPPSGIAILDDLYVHRLRALQGVDDLVETVVNALKETGQLDNTYIVYTSDNGFHMGEHRGPRGKNLPYEEDIRVPFVIRGPHIPKGVTRDYFSLNIDLAPSFLEMAGLTIPDSVDGRSLLGPIQKNQTSNWRSHFLIQRGEESLVAQMELGDESLTSDTPSFKGIRGPGFTYIEWGDGSTEYYDLTKDVYQLDNVANSLPAEKRAALSARLHQLFECAGVQCRQLEQMTLP